MRVQSPKMGQVTVVCKENQSDIEVMMPNSLETVAVPGWDRLWIKLPDSSTLIIQHIPGR